MNTRLSTSTAFTDWVRGQVPTAEHMLALYESDFVVAFAVDNMDEDAFANWITNFEEPNPDYPVSPKIIQAAKWADLYGDAICVLLDAVSDQGTTANLPALEKPISGKPAGLDVFHPIVDGDGYDDPSPNELDELGYPLFLNVHIKGLTGNGFKIDKSRIIFFTGKKTRRSWRGEFVAISSLDDIIDYRRWRAAYGMRAGDVAVPAFHLNKETGEWSDTEVTSVNNAFGVDKTARTIGKVTMNPISQPLSIGELDSTALGLLNAVANDLGIMVNDIFQRQGNAEKVAPDSNQTAYIQALIGRQNKHTEAITKVLKAFGMEFDGWNSPWQEPFAQQLANIATLANIMNTSMDPETRAIAKTLLVTTYGKEIDYKQYLAEQLANIEREQQQLDAFTSGSGASGGSDGNKRRGDTKNRPGGDKRRD